MASGVKVTSKFKINQAVVNRIDAAVITSLEETAEALHDEVEQAQVMPFDTGALQGTKTFVDYTNSKRGRVSIISEGPYARYVYFHPELHFQTKENPNARGKWYEEWISGGKKDFCNKAFAEHLKRNGGL